MKAYTYQPSEVGLPSWPSGELRLAGTEDTRDPEEADVFICPGNLTQAVEIGLDKFPHMAGRENRHVFLDVSDTFTEAIGTPAILIRCNFRQWMKGRDPNSIPFAWPVEDYAECVAVPEGGFKYDISFQGWLSTTTRTDSAAACHRNTELKSDIATYQDFTGYIYHEPEGIRRRAEFRRSMKESRIALCPESIPGVLPYRFFEAMSAGRVPLLVSSGYVLPFSEEIPYREFCLFMESADAATADQVALGFVTTHSDDHIVKMGAKARLYFERYLDRTDWPEMMAYAVENKMREAGLLA